MADADHAVRERAVTLARPRLGTRRPFAGDCAAASDEHGRVRYAAALALGDLSGDDTVAPLLEVARRGLPDKWTRAAVLTGIRERKPRSRGAFVASGAGSDAEALPWLDPLARMVAEPAEEAVSADRADAGRRRAPGGAALLSALEGTVGASGATAHTTEMWPRSRTWKPWRTRLAWRPGWKAPCTKPGRGGRSRRGPAGACRRPPARLGSFDQAGALLADLLHPRETQDMHQAAVQALGMIADPRVADLLASGKHGGCSAPRFARRTLRAARGERTAIFLLEAGRSPQTIDPSAAANKTTRTRP